MKTTTFFVMWLLFLASIPCFAFNYIISFSGSGASTSVGDVLVQNLTKNTSVTVPAGNVLNLTDIATSVEQLSVSDEIIRVYPKAMDGTFTLTFFSKQAGSTQINVCSLDGRKVVGLNQYLHAGHNSFQLSLHGGSYAIQVIGEGYSYTTKIINQTCTQSNPGIAYVGTEKPTNTTLQKSISAPSGTTEMLYTAGNLLLYKAVSGNYSTFVTDVPTASKTTDFKFVECMDADGNHYPVVHIGAQTWMAENLKTTHYRNNVAIDYVPDNGAWSGLSTGGWCDYGNIAANGTKYGHLYNWNAVVDGRNIAPVGWHVPTNAEWTTLINFLGGVSLAGGKLKVTSAGYWNSPNSGATNETGFSAIPGGFRGWDGVSYSSFFNLGNLGLWWSTSSYVSNFSWYAGMYYDYGSAAMQAQLRPSGLSVRCMRDN